MTGNVELLVDVSGSTDGKNIWIDIGAEPVLCLRTNLDRTLHFFALCKEAIRRGSSVHYDLSNVTQVGIDAIGLLIAYIYDQSVRRGRPYRLTHPTDADACQRVKSWKPLKSVAHTSPDQARQISSSIVRLRGEQVINHAARELSSQISNCLVGENQKVKEIYRILIELMANTNNHAGSKDEALSWFSFVQMDQSGVEFAFIDNGVGILRSLNVVRHLKSVSRPGLIEALDAAEQLKDFSKTLIIKEAIRVEQAEQLQQTYQELINGRIPSSTGLQDRGKGIPLIRANIGSPIFKDANLITNGGAFDLKNDTSSLLGNSFPGTLFSLRLEGQLE